MATRVVEVSILAGELSTPVVEGSKAAPGTRVEVTKVEVGSKVAMVSKGAAMRLLEAGMGLVVVATIPIKVHLIFLVWAADQILCKERVAIWGR
jgi:hypothetical protein